MQLILFCGYAREYPWVDFLGTTHWNFMVKDHDVCNLVSNDSGGGKKTLCVESTGVNNKTNRVKC